MNTIRYCRIRAGLSQQELATRAGMTQPALARIELSQVNPRMDTVRRLLESCGMALELRPLPGTGVDRTSIRRMLALTPAQRLSLAAREARNLARILLMRKSAQRPFDPLWILRVLVKHRVRFVVIGGIAGRLWGSTTVTNDLDVCYARDRENLRALAAALKELKAKLRGAERDLPFVSDERTLELGDHFTFTTVGGNFDCLGRPAGTAGYESLARTATAMDLGKLTVPIAALEDLLLMKRTSGRPKDLIEAEVLAAVQDELLRS